MFLQPTLDVVIILGDLESEVTALMGVLLMSTNWFIICESFSITNVGKKTKGSATIRGSFVGEPMEGP